MNETSFVQKRDLDWQRLALLCAKADVSPSLLKPKEFREMIRLYRRVSTDLAIARTQTTNLQLIDHLNGLVGRAYAILYRSPNQKIGRAIGQAIITAAQVFRRRFLFVLVSFLLLIGSAGLSFTSLTVYPQTRIAIVSQMEEELFGHWKEGKFDQRSADEASMMAMFYASNNPRVAIVTGAISAATFGVGTAFIMYSTGMQLGALSYDMNSVGKLGHLYLSILPHGVTELSGIVVAGAAGLVLGFATIHPGRRKRGDALKEAGRDALVLLVTAFIMMFIAAPIEGYISFNPSVPDWARVAIILFSLVAWTLFWTGYGRDTEVKL